MVSILRTLAGLDRREIHHYPGVLVPLHEAHLYGQPSATGGATRRGSNGSGSSLRSGTSNDGKQRTSGVGHVRRDGVVGGEDGDASDGAVEDGSDTGQEHENENDDDGDDDIEDLGERRVMLEMTSAEYTIEGLRREMRRGAERGRRWTVYEIKSKLINKSIQDMGMGRYNWQLFVLCGFGWFADNLWMHGVSLTLPSLSATFGVSEKTVRLTTSSMYLGLCCGSFVWGVTSDMLGRRLAFNATLLITALFGLLAAFAPSWPAVCVAFALMGFGVGGNLPVDGALFLEFLPDARSSLLTLLSVWWPVGQLFSSLVAWFCIAHWPPELGWRYFVFANGVVTFVMFFIRCFVFDLFESPKFLLSRGRQDEAVSVVHGIAYRNGAKAWLTSEILNAVAHGADDFDQGGDDDDDDNHRSPPPSHHSNFRSNNSNNTTSPSTATVIKSKLAAFSAARLRPLFRHRTLGIATALIWFSWTTIGMGYPLFNAFLPQYLSHGGDSSSSSSPSSSSSLLSSSSFSSSSFSSSSFSSAFTLRTSDNDSLPTPISPETYRAYTIASFAGVPGSFLAAFLVDHPSPFLGRRGTLATSTLVSAVFLFLFVVLGTSPAAQLAVSCVEAFAQNIMYGVLFAFTPEMFPAPVRGAGTGVASFLNRFAGLVAPVVAATLPGEGASAPVILSSILIMSAFVSICLIPIETRGAQRL